MSLAEDVSTSARPASTARLITIAAIIGIGFMGSVVVSPLYTLYQAKFGFSEITLTLVYAVYVVGNLTSLLLFGQVSDQIGRKRAVVPALIVALASAVVFLVASHTVFLFLGRLLIGLAVGITSGAGTAWLADEFGPDHRAKATIWATVSNLLGIALGPLLGGVLAQYAPAPLRLPFIVYGALAIVLTVAIASLRAGRTPAVSRLRDVHVRVRVGVPRELVGAFATPAVTGFVVFSVGGLYFSLIPGIAQHELHLHNLAAGGAFVFELGMVAAVTILLAKRLPAATAMTSAQLVLLPAVAAVVLAQAIGSVVLLIIASALGGIALALGYRGSLEVINEIAPDDRRGEVTSAYLICCFAGNSLPVIGIGVLRTFTTPVTASLVFAIVIAVLSVGALCWRLRRTSARLHPSIRR